MRVVRRVGDHARGREREPGRPEGAGDGRDGRPRQEARAETEHAVGVVRFGRRLRAEEGGARLVRQRGGGAGGLVGQRVGREDGARRAAARQHVEQRRVPARRRARVRVDLEHVALATVQLRLDQSARPRRPARFLPVQTQDPHVGGPLRLQPAQVDAGRVVVAVPTLEAGTDKDALGAPPSRRDRRSCAAPRDTPRRDEDRRRPRRPQTSGGGAGQRAAAAAGWAAAAARTALRRRKAVTAHRGRAVSAPRAWCRVGESRPPCGATSTRAARPRRRERGCPPWLMPTLIPVDAVRRRCGRRRSVGVSDVPRATE